jgi:hypothetical protein
MKFLGFSATLHCSLFEREFKLLKSVVGRDEWKWENDKCLSLSSCCWG